MPNYYNPYNFYPASYNGVGQASFAPYVQQPMMQQSTSTQYKSMEWVEGEVGAKAFQMPQGWPANQPIPLWDSTDTVIYLKSWSPMGMPNPLQRAHYTLDGMKSGEKREGFSGDEKPDMSQYVRKEDLERMKQDLIDTIGQMNTSGTGVRKTASKGE